MVSCGVAGVRVLEKTWQRTGGCNLPTALGTPPCLSHLSQTPLSHLPRPAQLSSLSYSQVLSFKLPPRRVPGTTRYKEDKVLVGLLNADHNNVWVH